MRRAPRRPGTRSSRRGARTAASPTVSAPGTRCGSGWSRRCTAKTCASGPHPILSVQSQEGLREHSRRAAMSNVPADLKYTREHEWAKIDGDRARIGITAFAQEQLGDVVFVELPKVGAQVTSMQGFGVVESVKAVSDLFAPLSGEVVEVNAELSKKP